MIIKKITGDYVCYKNKTAHRVYLGKIPVLDTYNVIDFYYYWDTGNKSAQLSEWKHTLRGVPNTTYMLLPDEQQCKALPDFFNRYKNEITHLVFQRNGYYDFYYSNSTALEYVDLSCDSFDNDSMSNNFYNCCNLHTVAGIGNKVEQMYRTFYSCPNLVNIACGNNVQVMKETYKRCPKINQPVCGNNVQVMNGTYSDCYICDWIYNEETNEEYMVESGLVGPPVCGPNVIDMSYAYSGCGYMTGQPAIGPNVSIMSDTYSYCYNLSGSPVCTDNVINMAGAYRNCYRSLNYESGAPMSITKPDIISMKETTKDFIGLTGNPACGNSVVNMSYSYYGCGGLTGNPVCGPNVEDMSFSYADCVNLTGSPVCGNKVTNMSYAYYNCYLNKNSDLPGEKTVKNTSSLIGISGQPVCGPNVINMSYTYMDCANLTGTPVCGPNVVNFTGTYGFCENLTGSPVCGNCVKEMADTYYNCIKLTGNPACGPNVVDMSSTYANCSNLTGNPVCGPNVTGLSYTYCECVNLTGTPVCGSNVTNMTYAYYNCSNLIGTGVCGDNVNNMNYAYCNCNCLNVAVIGKRINKVAYAYEGCTNVSMAYVISSNLTQMTSCFKGKPNNQRLDIYVNSNSNSYNVCIGSGALIEDNFVWSNNGVCTYNDVYNIYIHPISNVEYMYKEQRHAAVYDTKNISKYPIIEGLTNGFTPDVIGSEVTLVKNSIDDVVTYINFSGDTDLTRIKYIPDSITNMSESFKYCTTLTGSPVCRDSVKNMHGAYYGCINLTEQPVCGTAVEIMSEAYYNCSNLTGEPVCGFSVINMTSAYSNCSNLIGNAVCGSKVIEMSNAYYGCSNITTPVCGNSVINMVNTYHNCTNLTGIAVLGSSVQNAHMAYSECPNIGNNAYFYSPNVTNAYQCFYNMEQAGRRLNVYVPKDSSTLTECIKTKGLYKHEYVMNQEITTNDQIYYYNTVANLYVYPVDDVEDTYKENEIYAKCIAYYTTNARGVVPVFNTGYEYEVEETKLNDGTFTVMIKPVANVAPSSISFANNKNLLSVTRINTSNLTNLDNAFMNCTGLTKGSVEYQRWDLSNIKSARNIFNGCTNIK